MDTPAGFINKKVALDILWRYAVFGPLIGGAPYLVTIIGVPFAYMLGLGPAVICGVLTLAWLKLGDTPAALPGPWHAAAFGALFGAVGAVVTQVAFMMYGSKTLDVLAAAGQALEETSTVSRMPLLFVLPNAVAAGAIMAAWTVRRLTRPVARPAVNTQMAALQKSVRNIYAAHQAKTAEKSHG